jgi:hypothetical protein
MFIGGELDFDAVTKYFHTDRNLPKKRSSVAEMAEINGPYRVMGQADRALPTRWPTTGGSSWRDFVQYFS